MDERNEGRDSLEQSPDGTPRTSVDESTSSSSYTPRPPQERRFFTPKGKANTAIVGGSTGFATGVALFTTGAVLSIGLPIIIVGSVVAAAALTLIIIAAIYRGKLNKLSNNASLPDYASPRRLTESPGAQRKN